MYQISIYEETYDMNIKLGDGKFIMKRIIVALSFAILMSMTFSLYSNAEEMYGTPQEDSKDLQFQDMLMLFLLPHINKAVTDYYSNLLTSSPTVYPYEVDVIHVERLYGFRGFIFKITLEVSPVVGPHIGVGKDLLTFQIASSISNTATLLNYEHLETYKLPPNWKHIVKDLDR